MPVPLAEAWEMARTAPGLAAEPDVLPGGLDWIAAPVPGTAAAALRAAGRWDGQAKLALDAEDVWYRARIALSGRHRLRFAGLATLAEVWLDGAKLLDSANMFRPCEAEAELAAGGVLHIRFRSLLRALEGRRGRPRWRPRMVGPPALRTVRTTLLGHMPGWCPEVQAVGPWRSVQAWALDGAAEPVECRLDSVLLPDGEGRLAVSLRLGGDAGPAWVEAGGIRAALVPDGPDRLAGMLALPGVRPWWPHTHGTPALHEVAAEIGGRRFALGAVGFRRIEVDRGADGQGFGLRVNGVSVFCRGANWITADLAALPDDDAAAAPLLALARDAGMNMLRVPGVAAYESDAFYAACDRLGLLVWQDFMFANFDYPADDPAFLAEAAAEAEAFLDRTRGRACLAVLCGGSEVAQQAAMLGVPGGGGESPLFDGALPALAARVRPDLPYVPHSPGGGALPFLPNAGVAHYYGVGAYLRPPDDARRAGVRFASECLAFAHVPENATIAAALRVWQTHDPRWKAAVPRDAGASWDFEDVRDHYLALLYGVDPRGLRTEDPDRYLDLSRACTGELIEAVFAEWRRPDSPCAGGLVWTFADLRPGAGWGVVDALGRPKPAWHALRRAFRPVQVAITDEGLNGLAIHLLNETAEAMPVDLALDCLAGGEVRVAGAARRIELPARGGLTLGSAELLESFFDITYAYRFGPPAHDATVATLRRADSGRVLAEAFHFPRGLSRPRAPLGLRARLARDADGWRLVLRTDRLAQSVHVADPRFRAAESWFHMAPGREYETRLFGPLDRAPAGEVLALNSDATLRYEVET